MTERSMQHDVQYWTREAENLARDARRSSAPDGAVAAVVAAVSGRRTLPWGLDGERCAGDPQMTLLAESFPCLRNAPGIRPWNPCHLDDWAVDVASSGERHAAAFLLWVVWDRTGTWRIPPFDLRAAWDAWDDRHRAAATDWMATPYRP